MKVVLFCGGQGLRLREYSDNIPKPMVPIGYRPIVWHLMKYYAHYGHKDFILCLGYRADVIKDYFLNYSETVSNDFVLSEGGKKITLLNKDIDSWSITFVDTGNDANVGQRLRKVKPYLAGEKRFLANYADNLSDLPLDKVQDHFEKLDKIAGFVCVRPSQSFHFVEIDDNNGVKGIVPASGAGKWINGGFFSFKQEIFDHINAGEELVIEPFHRLSQKGQLGTYRHEGFWHAMDTFKEKQTLEDLFLRSKAPWEVWKTNGAAR